MTVKVAVNGFGRIGRIFLRSVLENPDSGVEVVAVNDIASPDILAHMLKYDTTHGTMKEDVTVDDEGIHVGGHTIKVTSERDPADLPWKELGVDVVIESTGIFTDRAGAAKHLQAGARKVIISAPSGDPDVTIVLGVNEDEYDGSQHDVISNASCTTNSVAPMAKVLMDNFGITSGFMPALHAYTTEQQLQDQISLTRKGKPDLRRMRSAARNIVPASTGAAKALSVVIPELKGKLDGMAMRVPVPDGSVTDLVCVLDREVSVDEVNDAYKKASEQDNWKGRLVYTEDAIVSGDIVGNPASCIIDGLSTMANGNMVKVIGWYDNEWGYSNRLVDLVAKVGS
ncbi:type I glyceraldehyde-3-phosphate dehydrogenase [soil metagenome]